MIRILNIWLFLIIVSFTSCNRPKNNFEAYLPSPDSRIHIYFNHNNGEPYYLVYYKDEIITDWAQLGFKLSDNISLTNDLVISSTKSGSIKFVENEAITSTIPIQGDYNELIITFEKVKNPNIGFDLAIRSYNSGIAFRYVFKGEISEASPSLLSEETQFNLYTKSFSWTKVQDTSNLPVTFIADDKFSIIIDETIESGYPKIRLENVSNDKTRFKSLLNINSEIPPLKFKEGVESPWRIILINELEDQKKVNKDESEKTIE